MIIRCDDDNELLKYVIINGVSDNIGEILVQMVFGVNGTSDNNEDINISASDNDNKCVN